MRVLRVRHQEKSFYASLFDDHVVCLDRGLGLDAPIPLTELSLLPPVAPSKVVCAAVNYRSHAAEVGREVPDEPVLFFKPPSAVIPAGQPIVLPRASSRVDYEAELAVVIGRACRNVSEDKVAGHIFGYACANDVTARDLQQKDGLYGRAKGFDTFAPIGPWIATEVPDTGNLAIRTLVNGEARQEGNTSDMIFPVPALLSFISRVMTLLPGDVVLTGTPPGIGPIAPGDEVRIEIAGVGVLINPVVAEGETLAGELIQ
ncbi:fumarylacetoacetate hydrolase family protein [Desulfolutivibrio sulfoxidireducens]|uniref:fumarylacetoacetate hydrolase family protein n=1 Tax=Desulfolutivibrio sulfoxidireducens TaxID=2773299 RepID=UPI00159E73C2|nr:fumarylacetoacetate hydrolase family protein [Desulfolutivibrio sulfoxidireducens]QLA17175.1 hypothetical protein GD605_14300 [Desulfolutivibrio sulfoxidireducens]